MKILYVLIPCESSKFCFKCPFESSNVSDFQTLKSLLKINKKQSGPSKDNDDDDDTMTKRVKFSSPVSETVFDTLTQSGG